MFNRLSSLSNRAVMLILVGIALVSSLLSAVVNSLYSVDTSSGWWISWLQNFSTEMFGAFLTFVFIELIVVQRDKRQDEERELQNEKKRLIRELGSGVNEAAKRAAEEMRSRGWLGDGTLDGAQLQNANLHDANLRYASLKQANLRLADLSEARLRGANLDGATLVYINLQAAQLPDASLKETNMMRANLQGANLRNADLYAASSWNAKLQGAVLLEANLQSANLNDVEFDDNTVLPDGSKWTLGTDIGRFLDPNHPGFWRSDNPDSPAYRAKAVG